MYKTAYGTFDGNSWEDFCQQCFKLKYENDGYQEMPAWQGDLGIEGFTRSGILWVFGNCRVMPQDMVVNE
jgi:hypothetical protein